MYDLFGRKKRRLRLVMVLNRTKELLEEYNNISFDGFSPSEVALDLGILITQLELDKNFDKLRLVVLFAPTGIVQECAMANDWHSEYMELSSKFDYLIDRV